VHHDLVGSFEDLVDSEITQEPLDGVILEVAVASVHLEAVVHDVEALVGRELLGHRAVHRVVGVLRCDQVGSMSYHKARSFKVSGHLRKLELEVLVVSDRSTELFSALDVLGGRLDTGRGSTKGAARDVQSATI
jgi:hypothetical protein